MIYKNNDCLIYEYLSITRRILFDRGHEYMKLVFT